MILVINLNRLFFNEGLDDAFKQLIEMGIDEELLRRTLIGSFADRYFKGFQDTSEFWRQAREHLGVDDIETVMALFFEAYKPQEGVVEVLQELRTKMKIGFIANCPEDRADYMEQQYHFLKLFDMPMFSYEVGLIQPERPIFESFLNRYGLVISEVIYADDDEKNLETAKEIGFRTIAATTLKEVQKRS